MKSAFFNRPYLYFMALGLFQFLAPFKELLSYKKLIFEVPFKKIFENINFIKACIEQAVTQGIQLFILFLCIGGLFFAFANEKIRPFLWFCMIFLSIGSAGYYFQDQKKINFREVQKEFMEIDLKNNTVRVNINFKTISSEFLDDLKSALKNKWDVKVGQRFYGNASRVQTFYSDREVPLGVPIVLTHSEIKALIEKRQMFFRIVGEEKIFLAIRDIEGKALLERQDSLKVNDQNILLKSDQAFLIIFYIESKNGKLLRVYL